MEIFEKVKKFFEVEIVKYVKGSCFINEKKGDGLCKMYP